MDGTLCDVSESGRNFLRENGTSLDFLFFPIFKPGLLLPRLVKLDPPCSDERIPMPEQNDSSS